MTELVEPQNQEAEESVLGAMLISPRAIDSVIDVLEPGGATKFYRASHGHIYDACLRLHAEGRGVDHITVTDELELRGELDAAGGKVRMVELARLVPASSNVGHYATIVRESWLLRSVIRLGADVQRLGWERTGTGDEILSEAAQLFDEVRSSLEVRREETMTMWEASQYLDDKFKNPPIEGFGIPTPWSWLPSMHGGRLYVLGGYQADGKTVMAAHFFWKAVEAKIKTDLISLEMAKEDLAERLAANKGIPAKRVQSGVLLEEQKAHAARVIGDFVRAGETGTIIDAPAADIASIRRRVTLRRPKLLIVDHLHQFHVRPEYERQDLEGIVRGLWQIAREFDIAVLLLAQLSRSGDKKHPFPRPTMASLRGSAMIEALAWSVYFVWRERDERNIATSQAEWIVAKNRSGPMGVKPLLFHDRETRFTEVAREESSDA